MSPSPLNLVFSLSLFFILLHLSNSLKFNPSETQALLDIRNRLRDLPGSSFFSTWDFFPSSDSDPCANFAGISCTLDLSDSATFSVSALTLGTGLSDSPGLIGSLSPSIANLTSLTELVVKPGRISGPIPPQIGPNCRQLRLISVSNNLISGQIPESLSSLTQLHTLDLGHNQLTGPITTSIVSLLTNLKVLILSSNLLTGTVPNSISVTQLIHLDLRKNSLTGTFPPLPSTLRYLSLTDNSFSGPINAAFSSQLSNLTFIDLSMNQFSGKIPTAIFGLTQVYSLLLQRNNFSGPLILPDESITEWQVVDLSHNVISGEIATGLAAAETLFLNRNKLSGLIPDVFVTMVFDGRMTTFYAQHNFLTGFPTSSISPSWGRLPESVSVCLSYNCMDLPEDFAVSNLSSRNNINIG